MCVSESVCMWEQYMRLSNFRLCVYINTPVPVLPRTLVPVWKAC